MQKQIPIKNHIQEIELITRRIIVMLIFMGILVTLLITRLVYLQLVQNDLYSTLSKQNSLELLPIEPTRGLIFDRNGVLLAENIPVFSLDIVPDKATNLLQTLASISKIVPLSDDEIAQFRKQLKQHRRFDEIPLKMRLTEEEVARFAENQYRLPGVVVRARLMRHYPFGGSFIHVLGYVGRINTQELEKIDTINYSASNYIGKLGIEKFYENTLHGTVGYEKVENDASGETVRTLNQIKPIAGKHLRLTIDSKLQLAAEAALEGHRGAIVAIQPSTGQVLALVSKPTYDPNGFVLGVSTADFKILQQASDKPLYNRALRGLYPMASTIKPFLALQGLNTGIITSDTTIYDPGWFQLKNSSHIFYEMKRHGHGAVNLRRAIITSCDIYFYTLATKLGIQNIDDILTQFGYGKLTGIDLSEELPGVVASPAWKRRVKGITWYPGDTVNSGIGQGFMQTTPLQLAVATATLANRGQRFAPRLVLSDEPPVPVNKISVANKSYWETIIHAMEDTILSPEGTARSIGKDLQYTLAGKTGTAQIVSKNRHSVSDAEDDQDSGAEHLRDHSLFIAFAPVDKPQIAIAVVVENTKLAKIIARKILDFYLLNPQSLSAPTASANPSSRGLLEGSSQR